MTELPEGISRFIAEESFTADNIGLSGCDVRIFSDKVLKIEPYIWQTEEIVGVMKWLDGRLPVPRVIAHEIMGDRSFLLMSKIEGRMSCDKYYLERPRELIKLLAEAVDMLWRVDISDCPRSRSLDTELAEVGERVEKGLVGQNDLDGFSSAEELLKWLEANKPSDEPVFSHGDLCLPNIILAGGEVRGFIDLGDCGTADKWRDLALCWRSLKHNSDGTFGGRLYPDIDPDELFGELGITPDREKLRYYLLLDELFH